MVGCSAFRTWAGALQPALSLEVAAKVNESIREHHLHPINIGLLLPRSTGCGTPYYQERREKEARGHLILCLHRIYNEQDLAQPRSRLDRHEALEQVPPRPSSFR